VGKIHGSLSVGGRGLVRHHGSSMLGGGLGKKSWVSDGSGLKAFGKNESATYR